MTRWILHVKAFFLTLSLILSTGSCVSLHQTANIAEVKPQLIPLTGNISHPRSEISAMTWRGDHLILVPQYPDFEDRRNINVTRTNSSVFFSIPKKKIISFLENLSKEPLVPERIEIDYKNLEEVIRNFGYKFQGLESICMKEKEVFVTIEAVHLTVRDKMIGFLMKGSWSNDYKKITFDPQHLVELKPPIELADMAFESILLVDNKILVFFEANGKEVNPRAPVAKAFHTNDLSFQREIPFPNLEYRLTDLTPLDEKLRFWGINYHYPKEDSLLKVPERNPPPGKRREPLKEKFGQGNTHSQYPHVERLVEFQYHPDGITMTQQPPIQLSLIDSSRNWEAIVRLDNKGFLIATDTYPQTLLAFIPFSRPGK